jgi:8-amino-7-oxononanoate synthase
MDGDTAPLTELLALTEHYEAHLIVDEAHAVGVFNRGLVYELGLQQRIFATVVTFGKALGTHGAIVLGSKLLHDYLVNFARSFIYTTAAAFAQLAGIKVAYDYLGRSAAEQQALKENIALFKACVKAPGLINSDSGIQCIIIGGNELTANIAEMIRGKGFDVRPILSPTVPAGTERMRICLHAFNTHKDIVTLADLLNKHLYG